MDWAKAGDVVDWRDRDTDRERDCDCAWALLLKRPSPVRLYDGWLLLARIAFS